MTTTSREVFHRTYYLRKLSEQGVMTSDDGRDIKNLDIDELAWEYAKVKTKTKDIQTNCRHVRGDGEASQGVNAVLPGEDVKGSES